MEQQTIQEEEKQQQEPQKSSFLSDVAEILETVFVSIFVVILLFAYVVRPVTVDGDSMRETLHDKDRLLMSDLLYTPEYGDIVIVNNTHSYLYDEDGNLVEGNGLPQEKRLIKRIIATGGQEINIDFATGEVTVDGEVLDEPYIRELQPIRKTASPAIRSQYRKATILSWVTTGTILLTAVRSSLASCRGMRSLARRFSGSHRTISAVFIRI